MNELMKFEFEGKPLNVCMIDNQPWWIAKEVCDALNVTNSRYALKRLDDDEKSQLNYEQIREFDSSFKLPSKVRLLNIINEFGLYQLIFTSRKTEAKKFKRWVSHEVLPQIRKTGAYIQEDTNLIIDDSNIDKVDFKVKPSTLLLKYDELKDLEFEYQLKRSRSVTIRKLKHAINDLSKNMEEKQLSSDSSSYDSKHDEEILYNVTQIGEMIGNLSGIKVNSLLIEMGFQEKIDLKGFTYKSTDLGKPYSVLKDSGVRGNPIKILRWKESVIPLVKNHLTENYL